MAELTPPTSQLRTRLAQIGAGLAGGLLLGFIGGAVGMFIGRQQLQNGWGDLAGMIMGGLLAYPIGVAVGITILNRFLAVPHRFRQSLLGSAGGLLLVMLAGEPLRLNQAFWLMRLLAVLVPPITAVLLQQLFPPAPVKKKR